MLLEREKDGILAVVFEFFRIERRRGAGEWEYEEAVDGIVKRRSAVAEDWTVGALKALMC
jgi:hypothetical protein